MQGTISKGDRVFMSTTGHSLSYVEELVPDLRNKIVTTVTTSKLGGSKGSGNFLARMAEFSILI